MIYKVNRTHKRRTVYTMKSSTKSTAVFIRKCERYYKQDTG